MIMQSRSVRRKCILGQGIRNDGSDGSAVGGPVLFDFADRDNLKYSKLDFPLSGKFGYRLVIVTQEKVMQISVRNILRSLVR